MLALPIQIASPPSPDKCSSPSYVLLDKITRQAPFCASLATSAAVCVTWLTLASSAFRSQRYAWSSAPRLLDSRNILIPLSAQSFLYFVPLRAACELIIFILLANKVSGLYGILALFTGYALNPLQLSQYVYSLLTLALAAWLAPAIRKPRQPLKLVALAWLYVLDTAINLVYTGLFAASWINVLAQHLGQEPAFKAPGASTMNSTSGFTSPEVDASRVEVVATPAEGNLAGQDVTTYASVDGSNSGSDVLQSGSLASLIVVAVFFLIRLYFCLVVMSYARAMLRNYVLLTTSNTYSQSDDPALAENPFRPGREEGQGLVGAMGRFMLRFPSAKYWLGRDDAESAWETDAAGGLGERKFPKIRIPESMGGRLSGARNGVGASQLAGKKLEK